MSTRPSAVYPPLDGSVLLPSLVDFNLQHNASLPAFVYSEAVGSLTEISFLEFGRAAHRAAHLLFPRTEGPQSGVVAVIANVDTLLYGAIFAGLMQAGLIPFTISPLNSAEAIVEMLQKSGCHRILTTHASLGALMTQISALVPPEYRLSLQEVPTLAQCYPILGHETAADAFTPYPALAAPPEMDGVSLILHSSGSTGFPKPIPQTNRVVLGWCGLDLVVDSRRTFRFSGMHVPRGQIGWFTIDFLVPLTSLTSVSLYPPTSFYDHTKVPVVPTGDNIVEHCQRTGVTAVLGAPQLVELWIREPQIVEWLKAMDFMIVGGGPLAVKTGDALSRAGVKIVHQYGATELGMVTKILRDSAKRSPEDWHYMQFSDKVDVRWIPQADGTSESQFLDTEAHSVSVYNLPGVKGYATNDCWLPHPTKPDLWRIVGRLDDVIILATGMNVGPAPLENVIMSSPLITGIVVFGRGRERVGVLLEPAPGVAVGNLREFRNRIWPLVEDANKIAPAFGCISKDMIILAAADRPMARTAKGSVAKQATLRAYAVEIDALYDTVEASGHQSNLCPCKTESV